MEKKDGDQWMSQKSEEESDSRQTIVWLGKRAVLFLSFFLVNSLSFSRQFFVTFFLLSSVHSPSFWRLLKTTLDRFPSLSPLPFDSLSLSPFPFDSLFHSYFTSLTKASVLLAGYFLFFSFDSPVLSLFSRSFSLLHVPAARVNRVQRCIPLSSPLILSTLWRNKKEGTRKGKNEGRG